MAVRGGGSGGTRGPTLYYLMREQEVIKEQGNNKTVSLLFIYSKRRLE